MADITREHFNTKVSPKLRRNIRMYLSISGIMLVVIVYRIIVAGNSFQYPLLAFAIGLVVGFSVSRMYAISWDKEAEQVVSRMDAYGLMFLAAYIGFEIASHYFIEHWLEGPLVLTVVLSSVGGALIGRGIGMFNKMIKVLEMNI